MFNLCFGRAKKLNLLNFLVEKFYPQQFMLYIKLPHDSSAEINKSIIEHSKGVKNVQIVNREFIDIEARVKWRKSDVDKRVRSLYLKLPDFSLVELEEI